MAEHEVVKHAENIAEVIHHPKKPLWQKVTKILLEVLIIVFAISFSLFLERQRERKHDNEVEREFLTELRKDLTHKIVEFRQDSATYATITRSWKYMYQVSIGSRLADADSIRNASGSFNYVLLLNSNNSLFESIKASGKLYVIHDKVLLQKIISLYQESIPSLIKSIDLIYYRMNGQMRDLLNIHRNDKNDNDNLPELLQNNNTLSNLLSKYYEIGIVLGFYKQVIESSETIIEMIDSKIPPDK